MARVKELEHIYEATNKAAVIAIFTHNNPSGVELKRLTNQQNILDYFDRTVSKPP